MGNFSSLDPALTFTNGTNSSTSSFIGKAFQAWLLDPMPNKMGVSLGRISLASSLYQFQDEFDAQSSSILADMQRLISGSYFATKDMFAETTLYPTDGRNGYQNLAYANDGKPLANIGAFVIASSDVSTLSFRVLVIIPVILAALFSILQLLKMLSAPWSIDDGLSGSILYSYVDQFANGEDATADDWKRKDSMAYVSADKPARIRPTWKDKKSGPTWIKTDEEGGLAQGRAEMYYPEPISHGPNKLE
jgi:hypothetical protein